MEGSASYLWSIAPFAYRHILLQSPCVSASRAMPGWMVDERVKPCYTHLNETPSISAKVFGP